MIRFSSYQLPVLDAGGRYFLFIIGRAKRAPHWGSKSIVRFGDLLQLPPVNGSPVFQTVSRNPFAKNWAVQLLLTYGKNPWSMMS